MAVQAAKAFLTPADPTSHARRMGDDLARVVFTDPPYNLPMQGHESGLGEVKNDDFAMACGK
jgi:hypothetical protein